MSNARPTWFHSAAHKTSRDVLQGWFCCNVPLRVLTVTARVGGRHCASHIPSPLCGEQHRHLAMEPALQDASAALPGKVSWGGARNLMNAPPCWR